MFDSIVAGYIMISGMTIQERRRANEEKYNHIVGRKEAIKEKRRQKRRTQKQ